MSHLNMSLSLSQRLANRKEDKAYKNYRESNPDYGTRENGTRLVWFNSQKNCAAVWRFTGEAHKLIRLDHTGYFADNFQEEVIKGIVCQLPARDGEEQFLAGYEHDALCFELDIYSDKESAARAADSIAEHIAEEEREYQAKEAAKIQIEETKAENSELRARVRALRASIKDAQAAMAKNKARIERLEENYWEAVSN